jgi:hypothetical protein
LWGNVGMLIASVNTVMLSWMTLRCVIFPRWNALAPLYGKVILCMHFGSLLLPPFFFKFSDGFQLRDPSSKMVTDDEQFRNSMQSAIGTAFSTAAFNWYATIFVYTLHALPPAVFCASASFWYRWCDVVPEHEWVFIAGRIKVLLWLVHLLCPFSGLLGVIVLYQTGGATSNATWASCWLLIWVLPMCMVAAWKHWLPDGTADQKSLKQFVTDAGGYMIVYVLLLGLLITGQIGVDHDVDATFLVTCTIATTFLVGAVMFIIFQQEKLKDDICFADQRDIEEELTINIADGYVLVSSADNNGSVEVLRVSRWRQWCAHSLCCSPIVPLTACFGEVRASRWRANVNEFWSPLSAFLGEFKEQETPQEFGKRLPYRRLFLIGFLCLMGALLWQMTKHDLTTSAFVDFKDALAKLGYHIDWPQGGSMFDSLFRTYQHVRIASDWMLFAGWLLILAAVVVEPVLQWVQHKRHQSVALGWSRLFVGTALVVMFVGVVLPATPNYIEESGLDTTCPLKCAPEFNIFVQTLLRNAVGLACTGLFAEHLVVLLLAVPVAMVRVAYYILTDEYEIHHRVTVNSDARANFA